MGLVITFSKDRFSHGTLSDDFTFDENSQVFGIGHIFNDEISYIPLIEIPKLETIDEYQAWAEDDDISIFFFDTDSRQVDYDETMTFIRVEEKYTFEGDYIKIIVE